MGSTPPPNPSSPALSAVKGAGGGYKGEEPAVSPSGQGGLADETVLAYKLSYPQVRGKKRYSQFASPIVILIQSTKQRT